MVMEQRCSLEAKLLAECFQKMLANGGRAGADAAFTEH